VIQPASSSVIRSSSLKLLLFFFNTASMFIKTTWQENDVFTANKVLPVYLTDDWCYSTHVWLLDLLSDLLVRVFACRRFEYVRTKEEMSKEDEVCSIHDQRHFEIFVADLTRFTALLVLPSFQIDPTADYHLCQLK
jgi:hypothetical protein